MGGYRLTGKGFLLEVTGNLETSMMSHNTVNDVNTTGLYALKRLKWHIKMFSGENNFFIEDPKTTVMMPN